MLKLYGSLPSRTFRCLWMLEEVGAPYDWVRVSRDELKSPAYLALNPNARMPVLQDGALTLWESLAINLYLAEKYSATLWPADIVARAHILKWSFWAATEIEAAVVATIGVPRDLPHDVYTRLRAPLRVLDDTLKQSRYLLGETFTAADINVAGILSTVANRPFMDEFSHALRWLWRCLARDYPKRFFRTVPAALEPTREMP
jgi:glutathione S-transferase